MPASTLFGKTNVPLKLADWQSYNEVYGLTKILGPARTPGGSSGGSARGAGGGLTGSRPAATSAPSIRNPAHYCGVFGHKPTWGVVSPRGHALNGNVAQADISVCGPLARGAEDLEIAMDVMAGPDAIDGRGWTLTLAALEEKKLRDFKVAVVVEQTPIAKSTSRCRTRSISSPTSSRKKKAQGERQGAAGNRHGRAERRLHPAAARGDLGPAVGRSAGARRRAMRRR